MQYVPCAFIWQIYCVPPKHLKHKYTIRPSERHTLPSAFYSRYGSRKQATVCKLQLLCNNEEVILSGRFQFSRNIGKYLSN